MHRKIAKIKPAVNKGVLLFLASFLWFSVGTMLLFLSFSWLNAFQVHGPFLEKLYDRSGDGCDGNIIAKFSDP